VELLRDVMELAKIVKNSFIFNTLKDEEIGEVLKITREKNFPRVK